MLRGFIILDEANNVSFKTPNIYSDYVFKQMKTMSNNKATGLDGISIRLLKECAGIISPRITGICNLIIKTGQFPDNWKKARVVPKVATPMILVTIGPYQFYRYAPTLLNSMCLITIMSILFSITSNLTNSLVSGSIYQSCQTVLIPID